MQSMIRRWAVDEEHAKRVCLTAQGYLEQVVDRWSLHHESFEESLKWSALLHEIGLLISHGQYHKHGSYVVGNADLSGFSRQDQAILAALVRGHRRKFPMEIFRSLGEDNLEPAIRLCVLLRLAVLMHRDRSEGPIPDVVVHANDSHLHLQFPSGWLQHHSLTVLDLEREANYLKDAAITLTFSG